jgi:hypothetical protein
MRTEKQEKAMKTAERKVELQNEELLARNTGPKNISVYLGDNREKFEALKEFYPDMTIPNVVNTFVKNYLAANAILLDDNLKARMAKNVDLGILLLEKFDKWTLENVEETKQGIIDKILGPDYFVVKSGSSQLLSDLSDRKKERLVLSLCELLFMADWDLREFFTQRMKKHDPYCGSAYENYWDAIIEDFPDYEDLTFKEFLKDGANVPILNPEILQGNSLFLETTSSVEDLLEYEYPHDDQLIWCVCLLDALADMLNDESEYDKSIKVIDSEKDVKNILTNILEFHMNHEDFNYNDAYLDIHTDGKLIRVGREFIYPVHVRDPTTESDEDKD